MREIKFRAVNADNELIYGLPYTDGTNETCYFKEYSNRLCWRREEDGAHCNQPYKNGTLMQYTGMEDNNGVEIYEGDIVKTETLCNDHSQKGAIAIKVVKFWRGSYHLCELNQDSGANLFRVLVVSRAEVIGNIYENPELLAQDSKMLEVNKINAQLCADYTDKVWTTEDVEDEVRRLANWIKERRCNE